MEDCHFEWNEIGLNSGGVPIPRPQLGSILSNSSLMSRPSQNSTANSIPVSASSSPFIENNSPFVQQNTSPLNFQYHSNSPMQQIFANDNIGLSLMPPNSPSPNMWQAQSMDLENEIDIKSEPYDMLSMETTLSDDMMSNFNDIEGFDDFPLNYNSVDDIITNNLSDTTCLDPQHSSPAAMAAVRPDEVMGITRPSSSYDTAQPSTSFGFSGLMINSPHISNVQQQFGNNSNQQQSHSFTSSNFPTNQVTRSNNNGSVAHSGMMSGGSFICTQQQAYDIKTEGENSSQLVSSYPPAGINLKDSPLLNCSSLPTKQPNQVVQQQEPVILVQQQFPSEAADKYVQENQLFQQLIHKNSHELFDSNAVKMEDSTFTFFDNDNQGCQEMKPFEMVIQSNPNPSKVSQTHQLNAQQLQQQQHQTVMAHNQMRSSPVLQSSPPVDANSPNTLENARIELQKMKEQNTNQIVHRSYLQRRQQRHVQQSLPLQISSRLSSVPATPVNTPTMHSSYLGASPTLRDMLQSPATTISSPTSPLSCSSPLTSHSPLPMNPQSPNVPTISMEEHPLFPLNHNHVVHHQGINSPHPRSPSYHTNVASGSSSQLSSSAPAHTFMDQLLWARREPRKHLVSTGSLAEEQQGGSPNSVLSPFPLEGSLVDSDEDSDNLNENYDSDSECESLSIMDGKGSNAASTSAGSSSKKERHFWQYNVQAKGPKGQRVSLESHLKDPHHLLTVTDPVFSYDCSLQGIKHSGKARRGDGNDLNPSPSKLVSIGKQLDSLNKMIADMTPVSEQPSHTRMKSRKEKNKLASRACRLKKKAQHEANKIKLYGLGEEHKFLLQKVQECRSLLYKKAGLKNTSNAEAMQLALTNKIDEIASNKPFQIAGQTPDFINSVILKCRNGRSNGGLDDLTTCMDNLRTSGQAGSSPDGGFSSFLDEEDSLGDLASSGLE